VKIISRTFFALALFAPIAAQAHKAWLLPSATVISKDQWVTFDAAVSNDLFYFNHVPMRTEGLTITAPDGGSVAAVNAHTGQYRSVFDLQATQNGTYRIAIVNNGLFANWEEGGQPKRWRGNAETFVKEVPADAAKLQVTQAANRMETFVTAGAPDTAALKPSGTGLELIPVTHPNDLYAGETATFKFQIDGAPAAGVDVLVIAGGSRYRDQPEEMQLKTNGEGLLEIQWPHAGMYWLSATIQDDKATTKPATARRAGYTATFEVLNP
jgi:uncharacterized GH25 family protein